MGEQLRKLNPAWFAVAVTIIIQVAAISFGYGRLSERQDHLEQEIIAIKVSDKEQTTKIGESATRLARIEEGVTYIRDVVRGMK